MPEHWFSLIHRFPSCKSRIEDSVLIQEYTSQRKPVFWYILSSVKPPSLYLLVYEICSNVTTIKTSTRNCGVLIILMLTLNK